MKMEKREGKRMPDMNRKDSENVLFAERPDSQVADDEIRIAVRGDDRDTQHEWHEG